jgi:hypothetical protein
MISSIIIGMVLESYVYLPFDKDGRSKDNNGAKTWGERASKLAMNHLRNCSRETKIMQTLVEKMFLYGNGNHRVIASCQPIDRIHRDDTKEHYSVDCILLAPDVTVVILLNAMHDLNRHVYSSLLPYILLVLFRQCT